MSVLALLKLRRQWFSRGRVLIDCSLSWKNCIQNIAVKIRRSYGIIAKLKYFVSPNTLLRIYKKWALILPYVSYWLAAWGLASKFYLTKIHILQKPALRFIFSVERYEHAVPLFTDADILPLIFFITNPFFCLKHDMRNQRAPMK